jgi:hypothetical protein
MAIEWRRDTKEVFALGINGSPHLLSVCLILITIFIASSRRVFDRSAVSANPGCAVGFLPNRTIKPRAALDAIRFYIHMRAGGADA